MLENGDKLKQLIFEHISVLRVKYKEFQSLDVDKNCRLESNKNLCFEQISRYRINTQIL